MGRSVRNAILVLFLSFGAALAAFAQGNAQFQGRVTDPQQRVVAGAEVRIVEKATGVEHKFTTNTEGIYTAPFLSAGTYVIAVQSTGFATASSEPLTLTVGQTLSFDVQLKVGGINEQVIVDAGGSVVMNTTDAAVSTVIDRQFVANIPLNGRSFQDLISLTPGVITASSQGGGSLGVNGDFSVNGQRTESNNYIVDGVSANFASGNGNSTGDAAGIVPAGTALGTTQALASIDDLQEFRVLSSSYSAEYGRAAGGQFTFVTRSGTNDLHGTLFEYLRNNYFDANNWFNNYLGQRPTPLRQNDFGGTFGGPVRIPKLYNGKDRTFFFVSYEGLRLIQPSAASVTSVPDLALRADAVPAIAPILNAFPLPNMGNELVPCTAGTNYSNATPYPCNALPTGTMVPSGLAEYALPYSLPSTINATSVRLDENITSKMNAFFRFSDTPSEVGSRQRGLANVTDVHSDTLTFTAGITNQLSSNIDNNFRLGYGSNSMNSHGYLDNFGGATPINYSAVEGIAGYPNPEPDTIFQIPGTVVAAFFITNYTDRSNQWNIVDTVSITKGHHQLKFGFDVRRISSLDADFNPLVFANFTNVWQLQNNMTPSLSIDAYQPGEPLFKQWALFAQDEWRVTSRLSLSMGLRWDVDGPPTTANGLAAYTLTGSIDNPSSLALAPRGTPLWKTPYLNFAPRLGAAYQLHTSQGWDTVVRAGGGVFFDTDNYIATSAYQSLGFYGFYSCPGLCGFPVTPAQIAAASPPVTPPYTSSNLYYFPTHMQLPYSLQWNLSVQQSLGAAQSFTVSYVGATARRLPDLAVYSLNSLNPNFGSVETAEGGIYSNYDALQASYQRKLSHGVQVLASYSWSHSLDNISGNTNSNHLQPIYSDSDFDLRHNFVAGVTWDLPAVNHDTFTRAALSHWGIDARFTDRTGFPVNVVGPGETDPTNGQQYDSGVNLVPGQPLYLYGADCAAYYIANGNPQKGRGCPGGRAIDPAAFTPTGTRAGTVRNNVRGFGENQINLAVRREFPIRENLRLQFRAESFNILNHPNFGSINTQLSSSNFGLSSGTLSGSLGTLSSLYQQGGPRSMQFSLKLIF